MTRAQIEEFAKKHMIAIVAIGGGAIVVIVLLIKRNQASSSTQSTATLDTIDKDLQQIDFDVNQIDTNLDVFGGPNQQPVSTGVPVASPTPVSPTPTKPVPPSGPVATPPIIKANPPSPAKFGGTKPPVATAAVKTGTGGPGNTYLDLVKDKWGFIGQGDYDTLYDQTYNIIWGYPGDANDYSGIN